MINDLDRTFGEIFDDDVSAFRNQLLEIQAHQANRKESEEWVQRLRFLDISGVTDLVRFREFTIPHRLVYTKEQFPSLHRYNTPSTLEIPVTQRKDDDGETPYVAVSWRWVLGSTASLPFGCGFVESFDYRVKRPGQGPHKSKLPDHYLERVICFAQSKGIEKIWVDTDCIYQKPGDDPNDKKLGVQIMDVVYQACTFAVGLLTTALMHQHEVDLLSTLLTQAIFVNQNDRHTPTLKPAVKSYEVEMLILRILHDPRWSRCWIFQEDHLASARMILMIPHSKHLQKGDQYDFGSIPDELLIKLSDFRQAVTTFCMTHSEDSHQRWPTSEILGKAKQYNIWNQKIYESSNNSLGHWDRNNNPTASAPVSNDITLWNDIPSPMLGSKAIMNSKTVYSNVSFYPSTTLSILDDICSRSLEKEEDRIAIMANTARFSFRLDTSQGSALSESSREYSMSVVLLALIILNGEFLQPTYMPSDELLSCTLRTYLSKTQYKFNAPNFKFSQSFIDRCRFKTQGISPTGIHIHGFLWQLLPPIKGKANPLKLMKADRDVLAQFSKTRNAMYIPGRRTFSPLAEKVLDILVSKLEKAYRNDLPLIELLKRHILIDKNSAPSQDDEENETPPPASSRSVLNMISAIVQALLDERDLRFAALVHSSSSSSDDDEDTDILPSAIFIAPARHQGWYAERVAVLRPKTNPSSKSTYVLTSWDSGSQNHGMERLASLEVRMMHGPLGNEDGVDTALLPCEWVNGVWEAEGESMERFTVPVPGLCDQRDGEIRRQMKRRLEAGEDEGVGQIKKRMV